MEAYPGQTRLYVIVASLIGLMIGVFMQTHIADVGAFRALGLLAFGGFGALVGKLLVVAQAPEAPPEQDESEAEDPEVSATRFFTVHSGLYTDEELRRLRVRSAQMPMSPPDAEVPLQVRDHDHYARVPVLEGVLERMTAREVAERVLAEAGNRAPKVVGGLDLTCVSFHAEGPLAPDGRSPFGWSFSLVDGRHGIACSATATDREIALHFHTAATYAAPEPWEWPDIEDALKWAETSMPEWADAQIYLRVNLPSDVLLYVREPQLAIADIDVSGAGVKNPGDLGARAAEEEVERWALDDVLAWFRGGDVEGPLLDALDDAGFAEGLRTLDRDSLRRVAAALERGTGAAIVDQISDAIQASEDAAERAELVHILAYVPSGLASVALHRIAVADMGEVSALASELHHEWRRGGFDVPRHPLDALSFLDVRTVMGRGTVSVVPLAPTYDPEGEFLPVLVELGFKLQRRRLLSGDANLMVSATLAAEDGKTELLLTSTPLPVPCHVLHVIGADADGVAARLRRSKINYPRSTIIADAHSGRPARIHQAALYIAALRIDEAHLSEHLIGALERTHQSPALRQAVFRALAVQSDSVAREHVLRVKSDSSHPDHERLISALQS